MGRRTYWQTRRAAVPSPPLGDANRGVCPWPCRAAVSNCGKARRAYPPERRAFPLSGAREDGSSSAAPGRNYTGSGGQAAGPRLSQRLLRRRRAGSRDRRAGPRDARSAGLRPQADRPQRARRPRPRAARSRVRRQRRAGVPEGSRVVLSAHGVSPAVRHSARSRGTSRDRRHLPARLARCTPRHGTSRGSATRSSSSATRATRRSTGRPARRRESILLVETRRAGGAVRRPRPRRLVYLTQTTLSVDDTDGDRRGPPPPLSRPSRRPRRTTSATRRRTASAQSSGSSHADRPAARDRLPQQLELEPSRRRRPAPATWTPT